MLGFAGPTLHEFTLKLPCPAQAFVDALLQQNILAGLNVADFMPSVADADRLLIVAVTEKRTHGELDHFVEQAAQVLARLGTP